MSMESSVGVIIFAGGKRVLNPETAPELPKLLEDVCGTPVLGHVIAAVRGMKKLHIGENITVVISTRYEEVLRTFLRRYDVNIAVQEYHHGTADAVWQSIAQGTYPNSQFLLTLMGDQPLIPASVLESFCAEMLTHRTRGGILTFEEHRSNDNYKKCGVIVRDTRGNFQHIASRTPIPRHVEELHAGPYIFESSWLKGILTVLYPYHKNPLEDAPEFHLYEPLQAACADTGVLIHKDKSDGDFLGVDTLGALAEVRERMRTRM